MILLAPIKTEKAIQKIEAENSLSFYVSLPSNKVEIAREIETLFKVKVFSVNTRINSKGKKIAVIRLDKSSKADDVATKLKIIA